MIELKEFQKRAADEVADRFMQYYDDPPVGGTKKNPRNIPFYQALASITASGKTVILADAVATICMRLPIDPVVMWLSKGKVVVDQTYANLAAGGKYHHLLGTARFSYLGEYNRTDVRDAKSPLVYFATVGTFNERQKEEGKRLIFRSEIDTAEESTWEAIKIRATADGIRRPLLLVYDEGHNITDQQMELLLELDPDALIAASATMRTPERLGAEIGALKNAGWTDEELITEVSAKAVADSGLVKSRIQIGGYEAPMEETIDSLISDFKDAESEATVHGVGPPKAIYVCKTNIVEGNSLQMDDPKQPFELRKSPPILIWRHLTENQGIDPGEIAIYASLKTNKDYPLPDEFNLFKGGEKDYEAFTEGGFRHVIFNLSLQEGWDDPLVYFAYIDKSMESNIQVEQIIGRLLRQPGGVHYPVERLNSAHFYIRVDKRGVFNELLGKVNKKLASEAPGIKIVESKPGKAKPEPLPAKLEKKVFETGHVTDDAVGPIELIIENLTDYRNDQGENIQSAGARTLIQRVVGEDGEGKFEWEEFEHTNHVAARWLFQREVRRLFQNALGVAPTDSPKFDALVGFGSRAHMQIDAAARAVVDTYLEQVYLKQRTINEYVVGPVLVRRDEMELFTNALHEGYDGLNDLEARFARALDATGLTWYRNPSRSGYNIPLITLGPTRNFYPDFLAWNGKDVFAIDTTGGHLLKEKTGRKLLSIAPAKQGAGRLVVRLVSEGKFNAEVQQEDSVGFTIWGRKQDGSLKPTHVETVENAVKRAVQLDAADA